MRTIKFRGKDVNTGEWLYWQFGDDNGDTFYNKVIPETVCQFVMKHKGNDIYEHDLIRCFGFLFEVVFKEEIGVGCLLYLRNSILGRIPLGKGLELSDYELVGNVFDNL